MTTFAEAIAARGLKEPKLRSVRYWNSRPISDRSKVWPGRPCPSPWIYSRPDPEIKAAHEALNQTEDPAAYVRAWELLNHLKGA
jgi:hypothetical protein